MSDELEPTAIGYLLPDGDHPTNVFQGERVGQTIIKIKGLTDISQIGAPPFGLGDTLRVLTELECRDIKYYYNDDPKSPYYGELVKEYTVRPTRAVLAAWTDREDDDGVLRA